MPIFRLWAIVSLLACLVVAPSVAANGARGVELQQVLFDPDPNSSFEIGQVSNVMLRDTVTVPLYLHTAATVGYVECRFGWAASDLTLLSVTRGPGLPDSVAFADSLLGVSTERIVISDPDPFTIDTGQPIAYLRFEVQCFGWSHTTAIAFVADDNYNLYISNGLPRSPLRDDGAVQSAHETLVGVIGSREEALPGEQHVAWTYDLYQEIPGRLLSARVRFDPTVMHYDSISAGPELLGGSVSAVTHLDTVIVTFSPSCPFLPPHVESSVFVLHFSLLNGNDDYTTHLQLLQADRIDRCGTITHPQAYEGAIVHVPNHTMTADLGETYATPSATTYDVAMSMMSNAPINDYRLFVRFPAAQIRFVSAVGMGGYTVPAAAVDGSDTTLIQINASLGTNYPPTSNPVPTFKLRFAPRTTPQPVNTVFPITFFSTPFNTGRYDMDAPFGWHDADLTLLDGSITIQSGGGGGPTCPTLYVWNGSSYERDNTILAASDGVAAPVEATDYYMVTKPVAASDGTLRFQIREDGRQVSEFRGFKLLVADHPVARPVQVTKSGAVLTLGQPYAFLWAKDSHGNDISRLLAAHDDLVFASDEGGYFDVGFGQLGGGQAGRIGVSALAKPKDPRAELASLRGQLGQTRDKKLRVSVRTTSGDWRSISAEDARSEPNRVLTAIEPELMDPSQELVVRYSWEGAYRLDALEINAVAPFGGSLVQPHLLSTIHRKDGAPIADDGSGPLTLSPGEAIDLVFDASALPALGPQMERSYVFVATGRYETPGGVPSTLPTSFALEAGSPNPFGPSTAIHYSLPTASRVEIRILDVRGALVRSLVSAFEPAGTRMVTWDGRSDSGGRVSEGVYFCQMSAGPFAKTRKLILVR
jgi:hypothetical protein